MSFLDKVMFWKKEDEFNFDKIAEKDMSHDPFSQQLPGEEHGLSEDPFGEPQSSPQLGMPQRTSGFSPQQQPRSVSSSAPNFAPEGKDRDIELLNSKLDTIKAMLNSIDQRLSNMERGTQKPPQRLW